MRLWPFLCWALAGLISAGEGPADAANPLWDGQESVAEYAERVKLPPTKTLDLGNGVKLELVLIPAGKFIMGTPEPVPVDEENFHKQIVTSQALLAVGICVLLVLLRTIIMQAIRRRSRPQYSLACLLAMAIATGVAILSGMHWRKSVHTLETSKAEFQEAKARYSAAFADELPAHPVTLTRVFYLGKYEVTQQQYKQVMGESSSNFENKDNPVERVTWKDAQDFCQRLSALTKHTVRLPTEAEWEYSCRAGTKSVYRSGDRQKDLDRVAWHDANAKYTTHPVGQREPNAFGLYDMHGSVWEWCQEWYDNAYYARSPAEDPLGAEQGHYRVLRGGYWRTDPSFCRSTYRLISPPGACRDYIGFRVVVPVSRTP